MEEIIVISAKEKRQDFLYVLILFIIAGALLVWIIFNNNHIQIMGHTEEDGRSADHAKFIQEQKIIVPHFDGLLTTLDSNRTDPEKYPLEAPSVHVSTTYIETAEYTAHNEDSTSVRYYTLHHMKEFLTSYRIEVDRNHMLKANIDALRK